MDRSFLHSLSLRSRLLVGQALLPSFSLRSRQLVDRSYFSASRLARGNLWTWLFCHIWYILKEQKTWWCAVICLGLEMLVFWPQMTPNTTILGSDVLGWPRNLLFLNNGIKSFFLVYNLSRSENVWILTKIPPIWGRMTSDDLENHFDRNDRNDQFLLKFFINDF